MCACGLQLLLRSIPEQPMNTFAMVRQCQRQCRFCCCCMLSTESGSDLSDLIDWDSFFPESPGALLPLLCAC